MRESLKYQIWLHIAVVIFGTTGVLGKLIQLDAYHLVWYRLIIAFTAVGIFLVLTGHRLAAARARVWKMLGIGAILAAHWVTFFEAIKQSNVSVSLICFSSTALFTAFIEPFYYKRRVAWHEPLFGGFIIIGLYFVFRSEFNYVAGMQLSILSAVLAAWFMVLNSLLVRETDARTITFYELLGALATVTLFLLLSGRLEFSEPIMTGSDFGWLLILGIVCTAFSFLLSVQLVKRITPFSFVMAVNLEPVYAILLALLIWPESETMSRGFYAGAGIVVGMIFLNSYFQSRAKRKGIARVDSPS